MKSIYQSAIEFHVAQPPIVDLVTDWPVFHIRFFNTVTTTWKNVVFLLFTNTHTQHTCTFPLPLATNARTHTHAHSHIHIHTHMYTRTHTHTCTLTQGWITARTLAICHAVNIATIIIFPVLVVFLTRPGPGKNIT